MVGADLFNKWAQRVVKGRGTEVVHPPNGLKKLREMTERLSAVEEEAQLFCQAAEQMQDAMVLTKDNLIQYVNNAFCALYGYSRDEIVGHPTALLFAGSREEHKELGKQFQQVFRRENGLAKTEYKDRRKDGSVFWASTISGVVHTKQGLYWVSTIRNVTERKRAESTIRFNEALFSRLDADIHGTILIVDDDEIGRDVLSALLLKDGYDLVFAVNGAEALEKALELTPDLILLDVMMPDIDGFEVCRRFRADSLLSKVLVILVTALDDNGSRSLGLEAGADDFVSKPFDKVELRIRVRNMMRFSCYRRSLSKMSVGMNSM